MGAFGCLFRSCLGGVWGGVLVCMVCCFMAWNWFWVGGVVFLVGVGLFFGVGEGGLGGVEGCGWEVLGAVARLGLVGVVYLRESCGL